MIPQTTEVSSSKSKHITTLLIMFRDCPQAWGKPWFSTQPGDSLLGYKKTLLTLEPKFLEQHVLPHFKATALPPPRLAHFLFLSPGASPP